MDEKLLTAGQGSLADIAFDQMKAQIVSGALKPRSRLPSETELARRFGISRPVVRTALARLREEGLIRSRQGSGSYVLEGAVTSEPRPSPLFPDIKSIAELASFISFREGLEGEAAAMAAVRHTDEQLAQLRAVADKLISSSDVGTIAQNDFEFHLTVAQASGNAFYFNTVNSLQKQFHFCMQLGWNFSDGDSASREQVFAQHLEVVDAIAAGDADVARDAMRRHLQLTRSRILTGAF